MPAKVITPAEYYDQDNGGSIPVFRPTMAQFRDFASFMEAIDSYGKEAGIVKVIPPKEWIDALPNNRKALERVRVRNPIIQHILGSQGLYTQTNIEKRRPYTLNQWRTLCDQKQHRPPTIGLGRTAQSPVTPKRAKTSPTHSKTRAMPASDPTPLAGAAKRALEQEEIELAESDKPVPIHFDPHTLDQTQYSVEYCKEVERIYWRNLTYSQPMYGADMAGTLFDKSVSSWNVSSLDNILNHLDVAIPGVNEPYLYFGMWKATFPWHVEDMDLYSINYLHFGAPKQWYAIPSRHSKKFEGVMQSTFYQQYKACSEFLRHKTHIASPKFLANHAISVQRCVQYQGEFIITFPFGYHSGYNLGLNCAESVNFALASWIDIGKRAKACNCIADSVTIDVSALQPSAVIKTKPVAQKKLLQKQCILCPSIHASVRPSSMVKTEEGNWIHRLCAEAIAGLSIHRLSKSRCKVKGLTNVPRARWKLLCLYCREPQGACAQCCSMKCCRAFHVTCAEKAGATMIKNNDENYSDIYCPQHDPKHIQKRQASKQAFYDQLARQLYVGRRIWAVFRGTENCSGTIESINNEKRTCRIRCDLGFTSTVPWRDIRLE
ncbi:JmjC domain, hydroxylase-domain-containing protein [Radiomyces spectabilis]|uniref:JmjC domain, hydroxylase-domain-containing protein n=1 Tax=Radiomyces spectabilis TaxID=64574 RepID=UPI00222111A3|nr:JmjC domain, hydroxylase-domain-containing protein [Radiomyces spectabilis]KAI8376564.1 JmjC domain, hydroxylase-domain-containing protein [Radiomyces spectabilis]